MSKTTESIPIVFILAKGRSGTTLLQTMLDAHPNTIAPFESRFVMHFKNKFGKITKWTPEIKATFLSMVFLEQKIYLFWDIDKDKAIKLINALPENTSYGNVCKQIYLSVNSAFEKEQPKVIIDKNPIYALLIPSILEVYPNAKFIHCIRDYRACANSTKKLQISKDIKTIGYEWLLSNTEIEHYKKQYSDHFLTIRYEDLLVTSEMTLKDICDFLHISYSSQLLEYHTKTAEATINFIKNADTIEIKKIREIGANLVHKNLSRPLDPTLMENWRKHLVESQINELDLICSFYGKIYQYHSNIMKQQCSIPFKVKLKKIKIQLYYNLPIWFRELKSKPTLVFLKLKG